MVSITSNEARVINLLFRSLDSDLNINAIARNLDLSPRGAFKILKKLEERGVLISRKVGNNSIYAIDFSSGISADFCQFSLIEELVPYVRVWADDLKPLKDLCGIGIIFGSVLSKGRNAGDVDILLVLKPEFLENVQKEIRRINQIKPKEIHPVFQTEDDLVRNLASKDTVVAEALKKGKIIWGRAELVEAVKRAKQKDIPLVPETGRERKRAQRTSQTKRP